MIKLKQLTVLSIPINNDLEELSKKSIEILKQTKIIIVEEYKIGKKILDLLKIPIKTKRIIELNEHNNNSIENIFYEIINYQTAVLFSDSGTPVTADPGYNLIKKLIEYKIKISHIPAISSILSALILSGFNPVNFYYAGFPPRKSFERDKYFTRISSNRDIIIIMETPYRFNKLITEIYKYFNKNREITICFNIGLDNEFIFRGNIKESYNFFKDKIKKKDMFVIVIDSMWKYRN